MRRQPTEEQKARAQARRAKFRELAKRVSEMTDIERARLTDKLGAVPTCEGRMLSLRNTLLLMLQCPGVSMVGGFRQWKRAGRSVRKGEHGSMIWVRTGPKDEKDEGRFLMGTVFDISQTDPIEEVAQ